VVVVPSAVTEDIPNFNPGKAAEDHGTQTDFRDHDGEAAKGSIGGSNNGSCPTCP